MPNSPLPIPLAAQRALRRLGTDISAARRRRQLPLEIVAERAFTTRQTVARIERGDPKVAIGTVAAVLFALGLVDRLRELAAPAHDDVGLALEEERLPRRVRLAGDAGRRGAKNTRDAQPHDGESAEVKTDQSKP